MSASVSYIEFRQWTSSLSLETENKSSDEIWGELFQFSVSLNNLNSLLKSSKVENIIVLVVLVVISLCNATTTRRTHFRSVGKNYNINYNSNTNTNYDFTRLYQTILEHVTGSEIKVPCPHGRCQQFYEHFAASFSSDQDQDEEDEDYFYDDSIAADDEGNLFSTVGVADTFSESQSAKIKPITDDAKLQIRQLDADEKIEAPSAVPLVNQSDPIISFDSISVERIAE